MQKNHGRDDSFKRSRSSSGAYHYGEVEVPVVPLRTTGDIGTPVVYPWHSTCTIPCNALKQQPWSPIMHAWKSLKLAGKSQHYWYLVLWLLVALNPKLPVQRSALQPPHALLPALGSVSSEPWSNQPRKITCACDSTAVALPMHLHVALVLVHMRAHNQ